MTKRMLIDATHAEETRVVVLDANRLEDFDVETATKRQLKGNIYLAKVVRVEPSLQAAFVEYGGGRHGFLAFGEIHPDYYQIPIADRERLLQLQAQEAREEAEAEDNEDEAAPAEPTEPSEPAAQPAAIEAAAVIEGGEAFTAPAEVLLPTLADDQPMLPELPALAGGDDAEMIGFDPPPAELPPPEIVGGEGDGGEGAEEARPRHVSRFLRNYRIQEVIKRRQILLVQVVKEERGTKGAALTTYISLAGRFKIGRAH